MRPSLTPGNAGDAYLEIGNFAAVRAEGAASASLGARPKCSTARFDAAPSELLRQVLPIPRGGDPSLHGPVEAPKNALAADDKAFAWVARARPLAVTVVGTQTQWLRAAFERDPGVRAHLPSIRRATPPRRDARTDVVIFDRWAPPEPPDGPGAALRASGRYAVALGRGRRRPARRRRTSARRSWEIPASHPVVQGVDPFTLTVDRARSVLARRLWCRWRNPRTGTPLVYVNESPDSRLVVVTFSVNESNLTAAPGFPVLLGNAVDWLARPALFASQPGDGGSGAPGAAARLDRLRRGR